MQLAILHSAGSFGDFVGQKSGRQTVADRFSKDDQADLLLAF